MFRGGVIGNPKRNSRPDHAITLIGWGMSHKQREYFIVKNSWGPDWGVDGFGLVEFGARGICESVSFPIVKGPYQASLDHFNNVAFFGEFPNRAMRVKLSLRCTLNANHH